MIEALNWAGNIGAVLSYPPVFLVALLVLVLKRMHKSADGFQLNLRKWHVHVATFLLIIGGVAYAVDLADRLGGIRAIQNALPLEVISGQSFADEEILLDGHDYEDCTFTNVKFAYNGTKAVFKHNTVKGLSVFTTNDPKISSYVSLLSLVGMLNAPTVTGPDMHPLPNNNTFLTRPSAAGGQNVSTPQ